MSIALPDFIKNWKNAIESGQSPAQIAKFYNPNALLKGTISSQTVQGHKEIEKYFVAFTNGKNDALVNFKSINKSPKGSYSGEYTFNWNDETGKNISVEANYTFEPDEGGLISLHHSSALPNDKG